MKICRKPIIILDVLSYFEPLRRLVDRGVTEGFIKASDGNIIVWVDGPESSDKHQTFDWGMAGIEAINVWQRSVNEADVLSREEKKQI